MVSSKRDSKKGKKKYLFVVVFLLIVVGVGIFIAIQNKKTTQNGNAKNVEATEGVDEAKKVVEDFLDAYQRGNGIETGKALYNNYLTDIVTFSDMEKLLAKGMQSKVGDAQYKDGVMKIDVEIENLDIEKVLEPLLEQQSEGTEEDINNQIQKALDEGKYKKTYECEALLYKVNGEWKINMTDDLSNAIHGGMNEYIDSLTDSEVGE